MFTPPRKKLFFSKIDFPEGPKNGFWLGGNPPKCLQTVPNWLWEAPRLQNHAKSPFSEFGAPGFTFFRSRVHWASRVHFLQITGSLGFTGSLSAASNWYVPDKRGWRPYTVAEGQLFHVSMSWAVASRSPARASPPPTTLLHQKADLRRVCGL